MLDCGLSMQSVLNFLPLSFVASNRLLNLPVWTHPDLTEVDLEGVSNLTYSSLYLYKFFLCYTIFEFAFLFCIDSCKNLFLYKQELRENYDRVFVDSPPEFCPPLDKLIDFAQVDVILISNYLCMMALPFVTEGTGFRGRVYCTEPTLQIGRYLFVLAENRLPEFGWVCFFQTVAGGVGDAYKTVSEIEFCHAVEELCAQASVSVERFV